MRLPSLAQAVQAIICLCLGTMATVLVVTVLALLFMFAQMVAR